MSTKKKLRLCAAALAAALAPACAGATLYSMAQGYSYTSGGHGYAGHEAWTAGSLRLSGGWYPTAHFAYTSDTTYQRILAPGLGLEKGLPGIGRLRAGYTYYTGALSQSQQGQTQSLGVGFFRAFTARLGTDVSYHLMDGNLFSTAYVFETPVQDGQSPLAHSIYHEAAMSVSYLATVAGLTPRLSAGLALEASSRAPGVLAETFGFSLPVAAGFSVDTSVSVRQGRTSSAYLSGGLSFGFGGKM